jgi:hypothetical protein
VVPPVPRWSEGYLLLPDEPAPEWHIKHKNFIGKVMFFCAQARPRWDHHTKTQWDGKIGIRLIGKYTKAQRNIKHLLAGTTEWDNENVDHEVNHDMMINLVFTEIMKKWPVGQWANPNFKIRIQQDGAGGHTIDDAYLTAPLEDLGLTDKISIYTQPPNSPDLNILDLGLFNALQAAYSDKPQRMKWSSSPWWSKPTYADYPYLKINMLFVTLQSVFNCILKHHGDNQFKLPHMDKDRLERERRLSVTLVCLFTLKGESHAPLFCCRC